MELDDFKSSWKVLHGQLEAQRSLNLHLLQESHLEKARHALRPLFWGQLLQGFSGLLLMGWAVSVWGSHLSEPYLLGSGLVFHVYGVALVIVSARVLHLLRALDDGAPVLELQDRMAKLRRFYIRSGMAVGLPWWVIWVPFMELVFHSLFGVDMLRHSPQILWIGLGGGLPGWIGTLLIHRWVMRRPMGTRHERFLAGKGLNDAQRRLEEIARFRDETAG